MRQLSLYRAEVKRHSWSKDIDTFVVAANTFDQALDKSRRWHHKAYNRNTASEVLSLTKFETLGLSGIVVDKG